MFGLSLIVTLTVVVQCFAADSAWRIEAPTLTPVSESRRHFSASLSRKGVEPTTIESDVPLTSLNNWFVSGDKLALLGDAGNASAVVIFDLANKQKIDWFYCYAPQRVTDTWIVYVEWSPNHTADLITDVVLLYDLSKNPLQNRVHPTSQIPAPESGRPIQVGIPIYPKANAEDKSYVNVAEDQGSVRIVLGGPGFVSMPHHRIAFIAAAQPGGDARTMSDQVVVVDLSKESSNPTIETIPIPVYLLPKPPERPDYVRVTGIKTVSTNQLRLYVPKEQYGVDSIVVAIPGM